MSVDTAVDFLSRVREDDQLRSHLLGMQWTEEENSISEALALAEREGYAFDKYEFFQALKTEIETQQGVGAVSDQELGRMNHHKGYTSTCCCSPTLTYTCIGCP